MVGVVSVAAVILAAGASSSAVQGWLPKTTVAYLEIRADLPGDQRAKVGDIIAKFPGFADQASLDAKIDEALQRILDGAGVSWTADVKPWLGGEVGVAVTAAAFVQASVPSLEAGDLSVHGPRPGPRRRRGPARLGQGCHRRQGVGRPRDRRQADDGDVCRRRDHDRVRPPEEQSRLRRPRQRPRARAREGRQGLPRHGRQEPGPVLRLLRRPPARAPPPPTSASATWT